MMAITSTHALLLLTYLSLVVVVGWCTFSLTANLNYQVKFFNCIPIFFTAATVGLCHEFSSPVVTITSVLLAGAIIIWQLFLKLTSSNTDSHLSALLQELPAGVLILGSQAEVCAANAIACKLLNRPHSEILGKIAFSPDWQLVSADGTPFTHPSPLLQPAQNLVVGVVTNRGGELEPQIQSGLRGIQNSTFKTQDSVIWLQVNTQPQLRPDGTLRQVICTLTDVTAQQRCEVSLEVSRSRLQKQSHVLVGLARRKTLEQGDLAKALQEITEAAAYTLGVERASVWLYDRESHKLRCVNLYEKNYHRHTSGLEVASADYTRYFQALKAERTIAVADVYSDHRTKEFSASYFSPLGVKSILDAPIWLSGEIVGVVCHGYTRSPRQWSLEEQNFAGSIADLVSLAFEASDRYKAEIALQQSEAKFQKLAANVPGVIYQFLLRTDGSYAFPYVSPSCQELVELEPQTIEQHPDWMMQMVPPESRQAFDESITHSAATLQPWLWEGKFTLPSGQVKWVQAASRPEMQPNGDILWDGLLMDITARKQIEAALRQSEELYRTLAKNFPNGSVLLFDRDLRYTLAEGTGLVKYGMPKESIEGKTMWEVFTPQVCAQIEPSYRAAIAGEARVREMVFDHRDYLMYTLPVKDEQGEIIAGMVMTQNITDRKQIEAALRQSEERYRNLVETSQDLIWSLDTQGHFTFVNQAVKEIYGYQVADMIGRPFSDFQTPQQAEQDLAVFERILAGESWFEYETQHLRHDGTPVYLSFNAIVLRDSTGNVLGATGTARDITERRLGEQALRDSEERFRHLAAATFEGIVIHHQGKVFAANEAALKICGYTFPEIQTMQPLEFIAPDYRDTCFHKIISGYEKPYESVCKRKDGSTVPIEMQGKNIPYQGGILRITAIRDITERKQSQAMLAKRERYLAALVEVQRQLLADNNEGNFYTYILESLGKAAGASRVYLFKNHRDLGGNLMMSQQAEWCAAGIPCKIDNPAWQTLSYAQDFPRWLEVLAQGEIINGIVAEFPVREQAILSPQGILALVVLPLMVNDEFYGFIGFDNCQEPRRWEGLEVDLLAAAAAAISLHQERTIAETALSQAKDELEVRVEQRTKALTVANAQLQLEISDRIAAESALHQSKVKYKQLAQQEELLNRLATQIRNSLDLDTILATAVQEIRALLQIDRCSFAWYHPPVCPLPTAEAGARQCPNSTGFDYPPFPTAPAFDVAASCRLADLEGVWEVVKESQHSSLPDMLGKYPASLFGSLGEQLINLEIVRIDDTSTYCEPRLSAFFTSLGHKSKLALPIKNRAGQIGVVVLTQCYQPHYWQDSEVNLLVGVINQLAIAIDQAHLFAQATQAAADAEAKTQELQRAITQLQTAQTHLVHNEKMSSLGQLVAGVAHEINNPVSFITGNLTYANEYIQHLLNILHLYQEHYPQPAQAIIEQAEAIDLEFVTTDLPKLLGSMQIGAQRISQIVMSLRNFSRLDEAEIKLVNLHEGLDNTLLILQHRLKAYGRLAAIQVIKEYGDLPMIECYPGKLNQVFMNILSNAIDALAQQRDIAPSNVKGAYTKSASTSTSAEPTIRISTQITRLGYVNIRISDNGSGIPENVISRVFDPFFTTKPVGSGTGLGLSISYQIIVEKHQGTLKCISAPGKGTEFCIEIPMRQ